MKFIFPILLFSVAIGCKNKTTTPNQTNRKAEIKEDRSDNKTDVFCSVPSSPPNNTEALYAEDVSQNTMAEKAFCEMAESKATKGSIRSFAAKIVFENDTINDAFIQIIIKKRILLVDGLRPQLQQELKTLEKETREFNQAFLKTIIMNYRRSVTAYESGLSKLNDVELKRDALNMLVIKKSHLEDAQHLLSQID